MHTSGVSLDAQRIAIVSIYFHPDNTGIAPYATDLCEILQGEGANVTALVGIPHYPQWRRATSRRDDFSMNEELNGTHVRRTRHFVPSKQTPIQRAAYETSFWLGTRLKSVGVRADAVIAITPNLGSVETALSIGRRSTAPVGIIVQDLMGAAAEQAGMQGAGRYAGMVSRLEGHLLKRATWVAVASSSFIPPLVRLGVPAEKLSHLPNYSHVEPVIDSKEESRRILGWPQNRKIILHTGNMGLKQDLGNVLAAARLAARPHPELEFIMLGDGNTRADLQRTALGQPNVRFIDPVDDHLYPFALSAADCLLINERSSVRDMSLPSKLTSYLISGRPIVAATQSDSATAHQMRSSGGGMMCSPGDPDGLLRTCIELLADASKMDALGDAGVNFARGALTRDISRAKILDLVQQLLGANAQYA